MKLGFFTAALPGNTLEQAAKWGAESGFQAIEIACWPLEKATRRYAGVTHIDVTRLNKAKAKDIRKMLDGFGLTISSLGYYPNPLHPGYSQPVSFDKRYAISHPVGSLLARGSFTSSDPGASLASL